MATDLTNKDSKNVHIDISILRDGDFEISMYHEDNGVEISMCAVVSASELETVIRMLQEQGN